RVPLAVHAIVAVPHVRVAGPVGVREVAARCGACPLDALGWFPQVGRPRTRCNVELAANGVPLAVDAGIPVAAARRRRTIQILELPTSGRPPGVDAQVAEAEPGFGRGAVLLE